MHFGGTELKAYLEWEDDVSGLKQVKAMCDSNDLNYCQGNTRTGPAKIIPGDPIEF